MKVMQPSYQKESNVEERLCCCEYMNMDGQRSHMLACCCDCEAVDQAFENMVTCRAVPPDLIDRIIDVILDRCRLPSSGSGSSSGAKRVKLDVIIPALYIPFSLYMSTLSPLLTAISFLSMPVVMLVFYRVWKRTKRRSTNFFFSWGVTSVAFAVYVFETSVLSFREVLLWENLLLVTLTILASYLLYLCRQDPGYVRQDKTVFREVRRPRRRDASRGHGDDDEVHFMTEAGESPTDGDDVEEKLAPSIPAYAVTWVDSRPFSDGELVTWCSSCHVVRQPRSGHCPVCNWCIEGRDHHCIWINFCVGARNHRSFVAAWFLLVVVGFYGAHLSLTSICTPEMYFDWFLLPNDCRFVYGDIYNAIAFVTCLYVLFCTSLLSLGLVHQLLLISQNLTMQEYHRAACRGLLAYRLLATCNANDRGFWRNWVAFWSATRRMDYDVKNPLLV